ncbi:undifferentiated embryonic cell transcription factor 1 [Thermosinus carboxydivorans Nor1]|uniref:Undifferentiated embryonic cell transcription factor 1 n=1 Tax=Thermosinus carboxydivorans Nor1 TaxID=401526 RepID=A1HR20_9FIRM|nr:hypothetical protein [Thermosinus carboxydivorans]EAX47565.1 undifferentiated embryonic cell transcription factor 1 [Thermosinus carboxydivorans Nor1]
MDFGLLIILMLVLYVLPELLKRRRPPKYEYPHIPQPAPPEPEPTGQAGAGMPPAMPIKPPLPPEVHVPAPTKAPETSPWEGKLNNALLVNGVIFAEILLPPRAKRPLVLRGRR